MIIHVAQKNFWNYFQIPKYQKFENFWKIRNSQNFWKIQNFSKSHISYLEGEGAEYPHLLPKRLQRQQSTPKNIDKYVRNSGTRPKISNKIFSEEKPGRNLKNAKVSYACAGVPDVCTYSFLLQITSRDIFASWKFFYELSEFSGAFHNFLKISKSPTIDTCMQFLLFGRKASFPMIFRRPKSSIGGWPPPPVTVKDPPATIDS